MPTIVTQPEYLSFDAASPFPAVPTATPGWKGVDYSPLWAELAERLGEDRHIPGVDGRIGIEREFDEFSFPLHMRFNGDADWEGTPYTDPLAGVRINLRYFRSNVLARKGLLPVTFHPYEGGTEVGEMIIDSWTAVPDENSGGDHFVAVLGLVLPASVLT